MTTAPAAEESLERSGPWTDLALTLPVFVGYHLGVVFLPMRNAADLLTRSLQQVADYDLWVYGALTLAIGIAYVTPLLLAGRGKHLDASRFAWLGTEGLVYAMVMRVVAGYAVMKLLLFVSAEGSSLVGLMRAAPALSSAAAELDGAGDVGARVTGAILSLGAGFYEELVFRVGLYGLGAVLLLFLLNVTARSARFFVRVGWGLTVACLFSGWHYLGELGETFDLTTFAFRAVCGVVFTVIYHLRGFAPAVWTHALYDLWVLAF
jgi:hypothetical protein